MMVPVPDEKLMAYADGELTSEETNALDTLLAKDAVLRARLAPFVHTRDQLSSAFAHTLHEPIPTRLIAAIANARVSARTARPPRKAAWGERMAGVLEAAAALLLPQGPSLAAAASIAALVTVGTAAGYMLGRASPPATPGLIATAGPSIGLVATGALASALEANPSGDTASDPAHGASIVPIVSFRTHENGVCREYRIRGADIRQDYAGLACRMSDGRWRVALHVETPKQPVPDGRHKTATAPSVPAIDKLVDELIAGDAFGEDETAIMNRGWQVSADRAVPPPGQ